MTAQPTHIDIEIIERTLDRCASQDPHYLADFIGHAFEDEQAMAFYLVRG